MTTNNTVGIEFPKNTVELDQLTYNIDPQHGGHKMPCGDAPLPSDCALSWVFRNAMTIHDQMYHGLFPWVVVSEDCVSLVCPKWDVDALLTAAVLAEIGNAAYMGTGGSQHFFRWGDSPDKKLTERIEMVRKLDTGELGQQLGDHPDIVGLARVAAGSRPLAEKIALGRDWLMGTQNDEIDKEVELARKEVEEGLSDAVVTWYGARLCVIRTKTLGQPSRGRSAAQKLGFDQGAHTVVQLSEDWTFQCGTQGTKYTITHKGHAPQLALRAALNRCEDPCGSWGGPIPQLGQESWILGSPIDRPSVVPPDVVVRKVCAVLGVDAAYDFMRQFGTDVVPEGTWPQEMWAYTRCARGWMDKFGCNCDEILGRAEFMHAFWGKFLGDGVLSK